MLSVEAAPLSFVYRFTVTSLRDHPQPSCSFGPSPICTPGTRSGLLLWRRGSMSPWSSWGLSSTLALGNAFGLGFSYFSFFYFRCSCFGASSCYSRIHMVATDRIPGGRISQLVLSFEASFRCSSDRDSLGKITRFKDRLLAHFRNSCYR
jgi:hypothetical protein